MVADLDGAAVVVTGAGRGLGRAYAEHAAAHRAAVVVNDVDLDGAEVTVGAIRAAGGRAIAVAADISTWDGAGTLIDACESEFGKIDGLVNNAGVFHVGPPWEETEQQMRRAIEVNVIGVMFCGVRAIEAMKRQGSGTIVNVASGALWGVPNMSTYGATKGAVMSATYGWAADVAAHGIRVQGLLPLAETDMSTINPNTRSQKLMPAAIAPVVTLLLAGAAPIGEIVRFDGRTLSVLERPRASTESAIVEDEWTLERLAEALPALGKSVSG